MAEQTISQTFDGQTFLIEHKSDHLLISKPDSQHKVRLMLWNKEEVESLQKIAAQIHESNQNQKKTFKSGLKTVSRKILHFIME